MTESVIGTLLYKITGDTKALDKGLDVSRQKISKTGESLVELGKKAAKDNHSVYVLCGDGETEEGQIWEAAMFAAHHKVDNLVAMTDVNGQQIDGTTESVAGLGDLEAKWQAFGWETISADGHDMDKILEAFAKAGELKGKGKPVMILFKTEMGHGVDFMAGTHKWHGSVPNDEQCGVALGQLQETLGDF